MKLLSVSSAIRMVLEGGVGSAPTSSFFGESPGAAFLAPLLCGVCLCCRFLVVLFFLFRLCFAGGFQRENKSKCGAFTHL